MLHSFFDQIDGDDFSYDFSSGDLGQDGEGLGPWEALPPTYIGSTTSLSQPELLSSGHSRREFENLLDFDFDSPSTFTAGFGPRSSTTPEILAAASALTQNTLVQSQKCSQPNNFHGPTATNHALSLPKLSSQPTSSAQEILGYAGHVFHNRDSRQGYETVPPGSYMNKSSALMAMNLPVTVSRPRYDGITQPPQILANNQDGAREPRSSLSNRNGNLVYGSDNNFGAFGFVPPPGQKTEKQIQEALLGTLQGLEPQNSATNTQPSSPVSQKQKRHIDTTSGGVQTPPTTSSGTRAHDDKAQVRLSEVTRPTKRQKSQAKSSSIGGDQDEVETEPGESNNLRSICRRRPSAPRRKNKSRLDSTSLPQTKSQPSHVDSYKPSRKNLSEAQKRENHIQSEKKRRDLIRLGYSQLSELVPSARGAGFTNRDVLDHSVEWLVSLMTGNERLELQLASLRGNDLT